MRFRTISLAAVLAAGLVSTTFAFAPKKGGDSTITAAGTHQPRLHRAIGHTAPANAKLGSLAGWQQIWDRDTDVPLRMWGPSLPYFASTADGPPAARAATDFLAAHVALLAPGAAPSDFAIIGNQLDPSGTIRTVGFQQYANGLRVEGGTIGITFERDLLVMVSSTALPHVAVRMPPASLARAPVEEGARAFLAGDNIATHVRAHGDRVIVPMVYERGVKRAPEIAYRVAETVQVEADRGAGRWDVWVDANDGTAFARARLNPGLAWLDNQLSATGNEDQDQCNAYSNGDDIHFYKETPGVCENTGRLADVVYHEFGHSVHINSLIPGQG